MSTSYFGWVEKPLTIKGANFEISPVEDFELAVHKVLRSSILQNDWIAPIERISEESNYYRNNVFYGLPSTHQLKLADNIYSFELGRIIIKFFGFLIGKNLNLSEERWMHRIPKDIGTLVSFVTSNKEIAICIEKIIEFMFNHKTNKKIENLIFASIHWYLNSQSYELQFERFLFQYMVLDNLYKLNIEMDGAQKKLHPHPERVQYLADKYTIPLPMSFQDKSLQKSNASRLVEARNALIHEALWCGKPIGYALSRDSSEMIHELIYFNSQLILATLNIKCAFRGVRHSYQIAALDVH